MQKNLVAVLIIGLCLFTSGCNNNNEDNNSNTNATDNSDPNNSTTNNDNQNNSEIQDKILAYLKDETIGVFKSYYELLDFKISDYEERTNNDNVESIFLYTFVSKNFDKDPDTVPYIKEAKENNDSNYQIYYDEYLQPKDANIELKGVVDKSGNIKLYADENPHAERSWVEFKMDDTLMSD